MDWSTPLGRAAVVSKVRNPAWYPPDSVRREHEEDGRPPLPRVVPPGPANPLGAYAMRLSVPGYLIHGTNKPDGIGMRVTHGCIRMYPEDIQWLFPQVSVQTPVQLVHQPFKMGWSGDALLLEVHRPLDEADEAAGSELTLINRLYIQATAERDADMDWELVEQTYRQRTGLPVVVGKARARETVVAAQP
jgi:L,D-transpeptidase ErfK/SrfK